MSTYLTTTPQREDFVVSGELAKDESGLVVVGVNNFDSDTFFFPPDDDATAPYVTVTDSERRIIRFSILRS